MGSTGRKDRSAQRASPRCLCVALLAGFAMSCASFGIDGAALRRDPSAPMVSATQAGSLTLDRQQLSAGFERMRERIEGAVEATKDSAGEIARRVRSRAITASDACFSADDEDGCTIAAKSACMRASYSDGSPLSSSTYVACSGTWGLWAADAPEGVCKTKRRLQAALCW